MALSTGGAGEGAEGRGGAMSAKGTGKSKINPSLAVKAELAQVESLKIQLKDTEAKKLGRPAGDRDIGQAQADAAEAQAQEPDSKKRKTKKSARGLTIKGYSDDERSSFSGVVTSCTSGATESRPLTALDDIIRALDYAMGLLKNKDMITEESATLDTFGFCISLWLEFAFQGKVSVAGREHRAYSLLRVDLQQTLLDANETLNTPGFVTLDSDGQKTCNALELARLLNENLTSQPVSEILWAEDDDGDERALRSVCEHMTCNRELTVVPWTAYISQKLHLPILMHQPVQDVVTSLLSESAAGRKYLLVDVISSLYSGICNILPPGMFGFAFDVAAAYGERKHFVEGTQEVFGNVDNLQKACSLRVTYLLELLKELLVLRKAGRIHLQVSEPLDGLIPKLHALRMTDPCFSNMVAFDAVQFATHWARDWTAILEKADSDDLMSFNDKLVAATEGLDTKDATQGTSSTTAKSITAASLFRSSSTNDIDIDGKDDDQANGGSENGQSGTAIPGSRSTGSAEGASAKQKRLTLYQVNTFCTTDEVMSAAGVLSHSDHAKSLEIKSMDTIFFKVLTRQLEMLQWQMYSAICRGEDSIVLNFESKKEGLCRMNVPVNDGLRLPFAGTITTTHSKGALHFCRLFGVDFYVQPRDPKESSITSSGCDVLVAAWHAKPVAKPADAYLYQEVTRMHFVCWRERNAGESDEHDKKMSESEPVESDPYGSASCAAELVFRLAKDDTEKEKLIGKAVMENWPHCHLACSGDCEMQVLRPADGIMEKLQAAVDKQKEKMEKAAVAMVKQSTKKKDREAKAAAKKQRRGKGAGRGGDDAEYDDDADLRACLKRKNDLEQQIADEKVKDEQEDGAVQAALDRAMDTCVMPDTLPLTKITIAKSASDDGVERSARQKAMAEALAAAEAKLKERMSAAASTSDNTSDVAADMLGMQAAINYFKTPGKGDKKGKGTEREHLCCSRINVSNRTRLAVCVNIQVKSLFTFVTFVWPVH
ncbi:unnamed protein product [Symbiodinium sp. CCMP2592]|nr:unnamed protein product [Symbiodinium sp. CCMP2592]